MDLFLSILPILLICVLFPLFWYFIKWYTNLCGKALDELLRNK